MNTFTSAEIAYFADQKLGRLATINQTGAPHVVPVGFSFNAELGTIDIAGYNLMKSLKYRNVLRNGLAAFVVDDVLPPWQPRGIEVRGRAEIIKKGGQEIIQNENVDAEFIRLTPQRIISWGIDTDPYHPNSRSV
ncbi:PPOX class F420-dependent oxidoreductase [Dictyobacter kobayashii]|uniref:PPOX class F420-dependent oxidoreductase n=1 Tax=Dictyobacter kobayashii TaxID=2014872 RepID=A0A402AAQ4_9CHLR|nr:PPOX class F420-dependent oxidoreductase [Dictyobacter kobayashii]GCE16237.1 PPOX class F420-dependent oxidoreductase [Dictyobacter kobayashii]